MVVDAVRKVTRRDRIVAFFLAGLLLTTVVICLSLQIVAIINHRDNPPTITTFVNGQAEVNGLPRWGRMPYLLVRSQKANGTIICPIMTDVRFADTGLGSETLPTFRNLSHPSCENINNDSGAVLVNFTMLVPDFDTGSCAGRGQHIFSFPHPPTIDIRFAVAATDGVDLFFAEPEAPVNAVLPPWQDSKTWMRYIGGIGDLSDKEGQYVHTHVTKGSRPKKGVFWGFKFWDLHTEETMEFTYSGYHPKRVPLYTKSGMPGVNFGWRITISSPIMMNRKPVSVLMQILDLLSQIGGWMTVATAVFYFFFVQKYPRSKDEQISERLALRWRTENTRAPSIEMVETSDTFTTK